MDDLCSQLQQEYDNEVKTRVEKLDAVFDEAVKTGDDTEVKKLIGELEKAIGGLREKLFCSEIITRTRDLEAKLNQRAEEFNLETRFQLKYPKIPESEYRRIKESLDSVFGPNNMEFLPSLTPEMLNDDYIEMMYPETQQQEDTKKGLISQRNNKWDPSFAIEKGGCGQAFVRSTKHELENLSHAIVFVESIRKPDSKDGAQHYGSKEGEDPQRDPLLPMLHKTFGDEATRFGHQLTKLKNKLAPKIEQKLRQTLGEGDYDVGVILTPASLFNLQTTFYHPENSANVFSEWTNTQLVDAKGNAIIPARYLVVGGSSTGGASSVTSFPYDEYGMRNTGVRFSVILKKKLKG